MAIGQRKAPAEMDFVEFARVMEEALANCGFDARNRWHRAAAAAKLAVKLSNRRSLLPNGSGLEA